MDDLNDRLIGRLEEEAEGRLVDLALKLLTEDEIRSTLSRSKKTGTREEPNEDFDEADLEDHEVRAWEKYGELLDLGEEGLAARIAEQDEARRKVEERKEIARKGSAVCQAILEAPEEQREKMLAALSPETREAWALYEEADRAFWEHMERPVQNGKNPGPESSRLLGIANARVETLHVLLGEQA